MMFSKRFQKEHLQSKVLHGVVSIYHLSIFTFFGSLIQQYVIIFYSFAQYRVSSLIKLGAVIFIHIYIGLYLNSEAYGGLYPFKL